MLLALWLYATLDGVGSARAIERLCEHHAAYRWLAGGVPANHDMLSEFRRDSGALLDQLLTQGLTALIAEGLISLEELAIDGTKVRRRAGHNSLAGRERLDRIETTVAERVATLKSELDQDAGADERKRQARSLRAAEERARRIHERSSGLRTRAGEARTGEAACQGRSEEKRAFGIDLRSGGAPDADGGWRHAPGVERAGGDRHGFCGDHRADRPAQ